MVGVECLLFVIWLWVEVVALDWLLVFVVLVILRGCVVMLAGAFVCGDFCGSCNCSCVVSGDCV